jgi:hypothetical protein
MLSLSKHEGADVGIRSIVIPAKAGIHARATRQASPWMPAFAGMTTEERQQAQDRSAGYRPFGSLRKLEAG